MTLIALLIYAQLADLFTFTMAIPHIGLAGESNPIVRALVTSLGIEALIALKLLAVVTTVAYLRIGIHFHKRITIFGITLGTAGFMANVASLSIAA